MKVYRFGPLWRHIRIMVIAFALLGIHGQAVLAQDGPVQVFPGPRPLMIDDVAHEGAALMPSGEVGWRVLDAVARPVAEAPLAQRSLGFVIAGRDGLIITDGATGTISPLAAGDAHLSQQGSYEIRASATAQPAAYLAIELVIAPDLENPVTIGSAATLAYAGDPFPAPSGERRVLLYAVTLANGEAVTVSDPGAPVLVINAVGSSVVTSADAAQAPVATRLRGGDALSVDGDIVITGEGRENTRVLIALIGDVTQSPLSRTQFSVMSHSCPPGMSLTSFDDTLCAESVAGLATWRLHSDRFATLTSADATIQGAITTWTGLPDGQYFVSLAPIHFTVGYTDYWIPSSNQITRQADGSTRIWHDAASATGPLRVYMFHG